MAQLRNAKLYIGEHAIPIGKLQEVDVEPSELDAETAQWVEDMRNWGQTMGHVFKITFDKVAADMRSLYAAFGADTKHNARRRYKRVMARQQGKRWEDIK